MSLEAFSEYLLLEKKYSNHTALAYIKDAETFQEFLNTHHNSINITQVGYSEIRQWIVELVNSGISNRTINRKVSSLYSYYKFLLKTQHLEVNPLKQHKALKIGKKVQLPFSEQELNIEKSLINMKGVKSCDVDAINYQLNVIVFEPEKNNNSIEIDDIKIVLANNNVEIKNYTQKVIID